MLKLFAALLLAVNPIVGLMADKINSFEDVFQKKTPLLNNTIDYQLPLQEDAFVFASFLPFYPERNWNITEPNLSAKIAFVFDASRNKTLFQKNGIFEARPIASLTKLMTAMVVLDNASLNSNFYVTAEAVATYGEMGNLRVGEELSVGSLLAALLIESSNDAAVALAQNVGATILNENKNENNEFSANTQKVFIQLMNAKASQMKLKDTIFFDSSGLEAQNQSSAWDLTQILKSALANSPLREILQTKESDVLSADGRYNHHLINTNKLLNLPEVIGGKTGYTEEAGNCMVLASKTPDEQEMLLIVVMGADDRLAETKTLLEWTKKAYLW